MSPCLPACTLIFFPRHLMPAGRKHVWLIMCLLCSAMLAETVHSVVDTLNQVRTSLKWPSDVLINKTSCRALAWHA